ncbi:AAA family ATPase [Herpetosiphon llansteffanensis]|uniref:AAA family ATPase n=1 Tax=Herpetosiphon llansteffanensis TaxID=2094568 RepID=UPI000D7CF221|nr:MoxR family ATPase [Herpetosiphon llansteffanensis]
MQYTERDAEMFRRTAAAIEAEIGKVIVGQRALIRQTLITLLAGGNALLEGVPGLAKTTLIRTLSDAVDCQFSRIQFTPDLMPADIIGTTIIAEDEQGQKEFRFQRGPIFSNLVLADEINRATPKTQSALLEAMQEHTVSVARTSYKLEEPFFVLATQNPLEMEGTYPLPEAQLDRFFFKINVPFPSPQELVEIAQRTTGTDQAKPQKVINGATLIQLQQMARSVPVATHVLSYAARIISATHPDSALAPEQVKRYVSYGSSPRGMQALILAGKIGALLDGRTNVAYRDLRDMATPTLRHRIILSFEGQAEGVNSESIVNSILESIKEEA